MIVQITTDRKSSILYNLTHFVPASNLICIKITPKHVILMFDCMVFKVVFNGISVIIRSGHCTYPCFPGALLSSTPHNIPSQPLAAFHMTIVETILGKNIGRAGDRTRDTCSQVLHTTG